MLRNLWFAASLLLFFGAGGCAGSHSVYPTAPIQRLPIRDGIERLPVQIRINQISGRSSMPRWRTLIGRPGESFAPEGLLDEQAAQRSLLKAFEAAGIEPGHLSGEGRDGVWCDVIVSWLPVDGGANMDAGMHIMFLFLVPAYLNWVVAEVRFELHPPGRDKVAFTYLIRQKRSVWMFNVAFFWIDFVTDFQSALMQTVPQFVQDAEQYLTRPKLARVNGETLAATEPIVAGSISQVR